MIRAMRNNGAILAIAALLSTGLVAITHSLTEDTIAEQQRLQLLEVLNQVIPADIHDNPLAKTCTLVTSQDLGTDAPMPVYLASKNGEPTAMAIEAIAPDGYNGAIKVLVGVDTNNTVLGVRVLQHNETPGLGDKIDLNVSDWVLSFSGKTLESADDKRWAVFKDGGQFDQFTGATITPRAVVSAARKAAWYVSQHQEQIIRQPRDCGDAS
ncbi:electron transport complex subunit RsxG [Enterovibrio norvegicus]|uniref:Ion-translocating oxidoreductase complex subunit G n=1 Tax=Enterovibrio norvegicus TaxID=188144 RepID=A0A2N7L9N1_9GAMM|nr:electron transport complex subunit RsxG [Enterovibrio norvegicus]PMN73791.1 electron transport complex subunit RsxG [Enterovibrio norvegicus]PMN91244.1 electron transport complex subunit RsxG [Enterovibrio norvegicus]